MLEVEAWREWRASSDGLTWRLATRDDMPAIQRMWEAKARLIGVRCDLPDLFASPVVLTIIAEDDKGRVVDGAFFEAVIDCTKLSGKAGGFRSLTGVASELGAFFRSRTFRRTTAAMPPKLSDQMADGLKRAGFFREALTLWTRWL